MFGKRVLARLEGKTLGTCHKCGASLKRGRSYLRANHCIRCNTSYHTYDCGNRMAAVLLAVNPAQCPKVRNICFPRSQLLLFLFLPSRHPSFQHKLLTRDMSPLPLTPPVDTRVVLQRLSLRVRIPRVSRPQDQSEEGKKAFVWRLNSTRNESENDEARRNIERSTAEGKEVFCSPTGHSLASFEAWLGLETAVPLLEQAQTFAATHAAASESSSSELRHACSSSPSKEKCATCVAHRVARLLRVHRFGDAIMVYYAFIGSGESEKGAL